MSIFQDILGTNSFVKLFLKLCYTLLDIVCSFIIERGEFRAGGAMVAYLHGMEGVGSSSLLRSTAAYAEFVI